MENKDLPECETCGHDYTDNDDWEEDVANIKSSGRCVFCEEEWGDTWPDQ